MNIIYWILGFPHIIVYLFFRHKINEINEDLATYTSGKTGIKALIYSLRRNEYRNVLYYRLPLIIRKLLNITLPRVPDCKIQCSSIGGGMNVHHGWATIVLADKIGHNFSVYQNVTVGYGKDGKPTIGNNVTIYTGAVVVGKIKIGDNVRIAANSVVRHDIPDNSLVYGNPPTILSNIRKAKEVR